MYQSFRRKLSYRRLLVCLAGFSVFWFLLLGSSATQNDTKEERYVRPKKVLYNLMEEQNGDPVIAEECSLKYVNSHKLPQDHPCILSLIRLLYLNKPAPSHLPIQLDKPRIINPSAGQVTAVLRLLRNQTGGFFIESGAADGQILSNTLYLERFMNWTGVLIEPEPVSYEALSKRNRKSWTVPLCLSTDKYPTAVSFNRTRIEGKILGNVVSQEELDSGKVVNVQCFPLYSIMMAQGRTKVDYFSLDVEGNELDVLRTIPWHKVDITVIIVEWEHIKEGYAALETYMKKQGYVNFGNISVLYASDVVFVKDFLLDLRPEDYEYYDE